MHVSTLNIYIYIHISCLPQTKGIKFIAPTPVDHTWAKIVASTTTTIDVPDNSDAATMYTELGSRAMGEMMSSVTIEDQGEPVHASIDSLQTARDAPPSYMTAPSNQDCRNPSI
jgi:hypothetical protein